MATTVWNPDGWTVARHEWTCGHRMIDAHLHDGHGHTDCQDCAGDRCPAPVPLEVRAGIAGAMSVRDQVASARRTGGNARFPYVPVVRHTTGGVRGDGYDEQIRARAWPTRDEAVADAAATIAIRADDLAHRLTIPRMRALRRDWGLPREIPAVTR